MNEEKDNKILQKDDVIINKKNATAKDILELVKYVKEEVYKKFGKIIELEIEMIGEE